ncbi:phosphohydrolase [Streptomyces sp. AB3(2024)]|uniref:phosphohydrolase n=1 Tax=Streptomyces sp. AB3(2024) TaxID=3317321 RepID=UPI0035A3836E
MTQQPLTLLEVEALARGAHEGQTDKAGRPYAEHLAAVAEGVRLRGGTPAQQAVAWLHDAVEDEALTPAELAETPVPQEVKAMVLALTKRPGEPVEEYAARILATPGAALVKEADLAHNADPVRLSVLDTPTRDRLTAKYAYVRSLLGITTP